MCFKRPVKSRKPYIVCAAVFFKTAHVACTLANAWCDKEGQHWTVTDVVNFSMRPIKLAAGTLLAEAE
jgi:hypothetical protein